MKLTLPFLMTVLALSIGGEARGRAPQGRCERQASSSYTTCVKGMPVPRGKWKCGRKCKSHLSRCVKTLYQALNKCHKHSVRREKSGKGLKTMRTKGRPYWWRPSPRRIRSLKRKPVVAGKVRVSERGRKRHKGKPGKVKHRSAK